MQNKIIRKINRIINNEDIKEFDSNPFKNQVFGASVATLLMAVKRMESN